MSMPENTIDMRFFKKVVDALKDFISKLKAVRRGAMQNARQIDLLPNGPEWRGKNPDATFKQTIWKAEFYLKRILNLETQMLEYNQLLDNWRETKGAPSMDTVVDGYLNVTKPFLEEYKLPLLDENKLERYAQSVIEQTTLINDDKVTEFKTFLIGIDGTKKSDVFQKIGGIKKFRGQTKNFYDPNKSGDDSDDEDEPTWKKSKYTNGNATDTKIGRLVAKLNRLSTKK